MPNKKYIQSYPQNQAQMADWQAKYKFDKGAGKWYDPMAQTVEPPTPPVPPQEEPPVKPTPELSLRTPRYTNERKNYFEGLDITPPTPGEETDIREEMRSKTQSQIDAVNTMYAGMISREEEAGVERSGQTRAIGARAGLMGSPRGEALKEKTKEYTTQQVKYLEEEKQVKIQGILVKIDERAEREIQLKRAEAFGMQEKYQAYLEETFEESKKDWTSLAQSGVSLDRIKENAEYYNQALEELDMNEFEFDMWFESNRPEGEKKEYYAPMKAADGKIVMFPKDGSTPVEYTYDVPTEPNEEIKVVDGEIWIVDKDTGTAKMPTGFRGKGGGIGGGGALFDTTIGQIDISTVAGLKKLKEEGYLYSDLYGSLDEETKLTATAIKNLLKEAGFESPVEVEKTEKSKTQAKSDLVTTIQEYKDLWKSEGDKNQYGGREDFIQKVLSSFPELTNGEILKMIDKNLPHSWMEENKKGDWWNPFN